MQKIKIKDNVEYSGHSIRNNGSVDLTLKAAYSQLSNTVMMMQLLNEDVTIKARIAAENGGKPFMLGSFRVKQITVSDDGESTLKFNGLKDYVETNNLNLLPLKSDEVSEFTILMEADIEDEEEDDDDE